MVNIYKYRLDGKLLHLHPVLLLAGFATVLYHLAPGDGDGDGEVLDQLAPGALL